MSEYRNAAVAKFGEPVGSGSGHDVAFKCPDCGKPKLYVSMVNGGYYCFACETKGKVGSKAPTRDFWTPPDPTKLRFTLPPTLEQINALPIERGDEGWEYLVDDRGFDPLNIELFDVRESIHRGPVKLRVVNGNGDIVARERKWLRLSDTIIFPIYDGGYRGYQLRDLYATEKHKRWLSAPGTPRSSLLYNADRAFQQSQAPVLVEGITDAIAVGPRAFATFGKAVTDKQLLRMVQQLAGKQLLIALDADARFEAEQLVSRLQPYDVRCLIVTFEGDEDPASVSDLAYRLKHAAPLHTRNTPARWDAARSALYARMLKR